MLTDGLYDLPTGKVPTIVTHLQMTAPAPTRDNVLPAGITFEDGTAEVAWYRDIFDRVGRPWMWFGRRMLEDVALLEVIRDPKVALYTLRKDGQDEALLELDFRQAGECEIAYFGLTPALIGSGAGRFLMDQAIRLAWAQEITRLHVHTCTFDSQQALAFYVRSGFTPYKQQVEIEDDPRLTGLLPRETGSHIPMLDGTSS